SGAAPINIGTANAGTVTIGRAATTTTIGGPLSILGATVTGPTSGTFSIDNGNASAINIGNASGLAPINIGTANASTVSIGRAAPTTTVAGPLVTLGRATQNTQVAGTLGSTGLITASGGLTVSAGTVTVTPFASGAVISTSGVLTSLNGTTGQVLTANTGAAPTWTTAAVSNVTK